jgi:hypothetical protein
MATRSFPIQVLRAELNRVLDRTASNMAVFKALPSKTTQDLLNGVGLRTRLPMEGTRRAFDVMDRTRLAWNNVEGIAALLLIEKGDTEMLLDSRDAVDLSILAAFNDAVEGHQAAPDLASA